MQQPRCGSNLSVHGQRNGESDAAHTCTRTHVRTHTHAHTCARTHTHTHTPEDYSAKKKNEAIPFATTWVDLESVILNKVSQTEKEKYPVTSLTRGI